MPRAHSAAWKYIQVKTKEICLCFKNLGCFWIAKEDRMVTDDTSSERHCVTTFEQQ